MAGPLPFGVRGVTIELRCPKCSRFMGEVDSYGRLLCDNCGSEVTYKSKEFRRARPAVMVSITEVRASTSA